MIDKESILSRMEEDMRLQGMADGTRENYLRCARKYLIFAEENGGELGEETRDAGRRGDGSFVLTKNI